MISFENLTELLSIDAIRTIEVKPKGFPQDIKLFPGIYSFECWGAKGGSNPTPNRTDHVKGGNGAYTFGMIRISSPRVFYAYVGLHSDEARIEGVFGGAGGGDLSGGGATDIRLINEDSLRGLKSRIIVAAGGGGADILEDGGWGGDFIGGNSGTSKGATQTEGGTGFQNGTFGRGAGTYNDINKTRDSNGGGGGGYYGGGSGQSEKGYSGSGGSSFISGLEGCVAVKDDESDPPTPSENSIHYSGITFYNAIMINGNSTIPSYHNTSSIFSKGNEDSGFMRIRLIKKLPFYSGQQFITLLFNVRVLMYSVINIKG